MASKLEEALSKLQVIENQYTANLKRIADFEKLYVQLSQEEKAEVNAAVKKLNCLKHPSILKIFGLQKGKDLVKTAKGGIEKAVSAFDKFVSGKK